MCGSRKIAEFLLLEDLKESLKKEDLTNKDLKPCHLLAKHEYILSYVAASKNAEWIKDIALTLVEAGKEKSEFSTFYADDSTMIHTINNIFPKETTKQGNKPNFS